MTQNPQYLAMQKSFADAPVAARSKADGAAKDDMLARTKGSSPEQVAARQRMAVLFANAHFPSDSPDDRKARLARIDYAMPLFTINARGIDVDNPKSKNLLGMGRKPAYMVSASHAPKTPDDPIYALEYFAVKS